MMTHAFNTGRGYGPRGQRIAFVVLDDGRAYFVDVDRGIDGVTAGIVDLSAIDAEAFPAPTHRELCDALMADYDRGNYVDDYDVKVAHRDGLSQVARGL
jgi:hypothetical protein